MRSVSNAWQMRLLAAVTVLALVLACIVGSYAHAAGHALPADPHATAAADNGGGVGEHVSKPEPSKPGHRRHADDCGGTGQSTFDCCDTICHGGHAILASSGFVLRSARYAPLIQSAAALDGAEPGALDRPPKPFSPA
jgi:hypothetical protein